MDRFYTNDEIKLATRSAIEFWRTCKRPDLSDEDKVRGALIKYQMSLDAAEMARVASVGRRVSIE